MGTKGRVAVVIVNLDGVAHIGECLDALRRQTFTDFFTMVFDNGSKDGSPEMVEGDYTEVELVRSASNLGFAAGNNRAIETCLSHERVEYVLTLNNDVTPGEDCIESLVRTLDENPVAWSCQPKMYLHGPKGDVPVFNSAGILVWRDGSAYNRGINEPDRGQYDRATDIFGTCAGCSLYRASVLRRTGLFDERFFAYMEDVDLAWRGRLLGFESLLCPEAACWHRHGASTTDPSAKIAFVEANRIRVLLKDYAASDVIASPVFTAYRMLLLARLSRGKGLTARLDAYSGGLGPWPLLKSVLKGWVRGVADARRCLRMRRAAMAEGAATGGLARRIARTYSAPLRGLLER